MTADRTPQPSGIEDLLVHATWLRGLAAALVHGSAEADDLVQETWVAAMKNPPPRGVSPRAWLTGIAKNLARMRLRGETRRALRQAAARDAAELPSPDELVARIETQRRLAALVAELPEPTRSIVILRFYEGLDSAEIARRRGEPAGTVRWRLKQGLDGLRARLDEQHGERSVWIVVLAPLALPRATSPHQATPATHIAPLGGVVSSVGKLAAVVLVALGLGALWHALREPTSSSSVPSATAAVAAASERSARGVEATRSDERRGSRRLETATAGGKEPQPSAAPERPADRNPAHVVGRIVGAEGAPLPGGSVRVDFADVGRPVDAAGRFAFDVDPPIEERSTEFEFRAPGRALRVLSKELVAGVRIDLGDVELAKGGSVSGIIVDEVGIPVGGARIVVASVPFEDVDAPAPASREPDPDLMFGPDDTAAYEVFDPTPRGPAFAAAADGTFTLTSLPVGEQALLRFMAPGHRNGGSRVTVQPNAPSASLRVVLPRQGDDEGIEGSVVAPDGSPVPDFQFQVEIVGGPAMGSTLARTDARGRFRLETRKGMTFRLRVCDEARAWVSETVGPLSPGSRNVKVQALAARRLEIVPRAGDGAVVTDFKVKVSPETAPASDPDTDYDFLVDLFFEQVKPNRPARVLAPRGTFSVSVEAPGYATATVPHLDASTSGDRIVVPLTRLPDYVGVVRSAAGTVAGATVQLFDARLGGQMAQAGFPLTRVHLPAARVTTDASGRFALTVREPGRWVVRAEAKGLVPGESEVTITAVGGGELPPIELTKGGAIEGTVRTGGTRNAQGLFVCASRGDGAIRSEALASDGKFRFEGLTPGPWMVRVLDAVPGDDAKVQITTVEAPIEWTCSVAANETTRQDLGYGAGAACTVRGTLRTTGDRKWLAGLEYPDVNRGSTYDPPVPVAADGTFALSTDRTGEYWLAVMDPDGRVRVHLPVRLARGEVRVDLALSVGSVEVAARAGEADPASVLVWEGERGAFATVSLRDANGRLVAPVVPAGRVRLVHPGTDSKQADPRRWPVDAEFDVVAGRTKVVELR